MLISTGITAICRDDDNFSQKNSNEVSNPCHLPVHIASFCYLFFKHKLVSSPPDFSEKVCLTARLQEFNK